MSWRDLGLIFEVNALADWACSHAYVPTALRMNDRIRVYVAFLDVESTGRLGYVDVALDDPRRILGYSERPLLDVTEPGAFDSDGITPMAIVRHGAQYRLYYAGWRRLRHQAARYTIFTGLAVSPDGTRFRRVCRYPILGPTYAGQTVRTVGAVIPLEEGWRCYFAEDVGLIDIKGKQTPSYRLSTMVSPDGVEWPVESDQVFPVKPGSVFGYGRSAVWKSAGHFHGLFSVRRIDGGYRSIDYAESRDGINWSEFTDCNKNFRADQTCDGQKQVCFPSLVHDNRRIIMFYNGNDFGRAGLRAAIWLKS